MGISLKSIELSNIRSHKYIKFSPADIGVTAISGPTGSGKSTVVDSLAWVLFGTKPKGVSKNSAIYREGADFKVDKCFAIAEIEVDGALLKIERKMMSKAGSVECNVSEWDEEENSWKHRAGAAPSHAEKYVRQRLKMDEKGFLTAVLIQQKQVDQLISAQPPERARVIEKLTGISSISSGITAARKEHNGLKKAIELTAVDESQLKTVESELSKEEAKLVKLKASYKSAKEKLQVVHGELKGFEDTVDTQTELFEQANEARGTLGEVEVKLEAADGILADATLERDEAKALLPETSRGVSFDESLQAIRSLRRSVASLESSKINLEKLRTQLADRIEELGPLLESSGMESAAVVEQRMRELEALESKLKGQLKTLRAESSELRGESTQLESAIEVVSQGDDCPTCRQSVSNVSLAVEALEKQLGGLKKKLAKIEHKMEVVSEEIEDNGSQFIDLKGVLALFEEHTKKTGSLDETKHEISDVASDLKAKSAELKGAEKLHSIAEREEEHKKRYNAALQRLQKVVKTIESLKSRRKTAKAVLDSTKAPSEQKLSTMRKKLYELQVGYQEGRVNLGELKADARVASSSIEHLTAKRELYAAELKRHRELLKSVEISAATLETLTEFRADRVKTALPTIESYASELLSRFTDGKFIALKLDDKFNASVVLSSGTERPVGMLSGGELSAAAIALRLSVSMMLTASDSSNLIILDEVLVSQDSDRSELILSTIRDVCKGQVVMIAHGEGVAAIADKKVELQGS